MSLKRFTGDLFLTCALQPVLFIPSQLQAVRGCNCEQTFRSTAINRIMYAPSLDTVNTFRVYLQYRADFTPTDLHIVCLLLGANCDSIRSSSILAKIIQTDTLVSREYF